MKPAQRDLPPARQLAMALDRHGLPRMTPAEHDAAVVSLANLLLEAAGVPARETRDDRG